MSKGCLLHGYSVTLHTYSDSLGWAQIKYMRTNGLGDNLVLQVMDLISFKYNCETVDSKKYRITFSHANLHMQILQQTYFILLHDYSVNCL